jgi:hypothetical protein
MFTEAALPRPQGRQVAGRLLFQLRSTCSVVSEVKPFGGGEVFRPRLTLGTSASQRLQLTPCSSICSRLPRRPLKLSGFGVDSQVRSFLRLSLLQPPRKSSGLGQALASCTFEVRGPSDEPRSFPTSGVGLHVQASGCLRNPRGFCRLLS